MADICDEKARIQYIQNKLFQAGLRQSHPVKMTYDREKMAPAMCALHDEGYSYHEIALAGNMAVSKVMALAKEGDEMKKRPGSRMEYVKLIVDGSDTGIMVYDVTLIMQAGSSYIKIYTGDVRVPTVVMLGVDRYEVEEVTRGGWDLRVFKTKGV